ncbi:MAG: transposase [Alphaproteobacteria bacterium]|nr:transposase [Alphaproteobacteria bacterium]
MARPARYFLRDQPLHVIQRGNNRQAIFFHDDDYAHCRDWLAAAASEHGLAIHAYVFMTNHVHLLATPQSENSLPRAMQSLGRRYVRRLNTIYQRTGTLWEGRYRAAPIESDAHFLACCRYIELNPVRAGMTRHPRDHRWSSYAAHALGMTDVLVSEHPLYRALGATPRDRQAAYRDLFEAELDPAFVDELRAATNGGWAIGSERFKREIAAALGRHVAPLPKGRRPKEKPVRDQGRLF